MHQPQNNDYDLAIAIIGLSCRFPGANNVEQFWQNLYDGVESISQFSDEELLSEGIDPALLNNPNYVKASGLLSDVDRFDAAFFNFSPKEAQLLDPQHRLFLECAWESLENAGYAPDTYNNSIGMFAGAGMSLYAGVGMTNYFLHNLYPNQETDGFQARLANGKEFLPTRVSYKLNLTGPSVNVQTACSTSLVAVHVACQSLLNGECNMALAGAVSIHLPQKVGYLYQEGAILSPDGHCRAFDAKAQGTVGGNGVGIVVLKRLADAIADGDCIHAVIRGSAINNDGSKKSSYTAPSVDGQAEVISMAQAVAGVDAETISYIETHGTGTLLGDPIEIAALTQAFRDNTDKKGFCAIGSVKTNIGHLDTAAGMAGLIKTVLSLKYKLLPPTLHFQQPNPKIDFANSPFYVNTQLSPWESKGTPRRAGVSSFGVGGTNAHVVLEEWIPSTQDRRTLDRSGKKHQLLLLSAKTSSALETATVNLTTYLQNHPELNLTDIAYTLSAGRKAFPHRRIVVCSELQEGINAFTSLDSKCVLNATVEAKTRSIVFMFSGQGSQYVNMTRELYDVEPTFRKQVDLCCEYLKPLLGFDLLQVLYPEDSHMARASQQLTKTAIAQPALFVIEYALAQLWMTWGIHPIATIGHSLGEYVAATLAGVFSLEDALSLVAIRGQLMQLMPSGSMLAVPLCEQEVQQFLTSSLEVAAINSPSNCVVSGTIAEIDALQQKLVQHGVESRRLHTSHAFHSQMMEPLQAPFLEQVQKVRLNPPQIPYLSNVTGTWVTVEQATDPAYWANHLRQTVRFAEGLQELLLQPELILLEIGPGRTLSSFAQRHSHKTVQQLVLTSVRHPQEQQSDVAFLLKTLGQLWLAGVEVDWFAFYAREQCDRLPLPTYPFERQRYWIEPQTKVKATHSVLHKKPDIADWFYIPSWKRSFLSTTESGKYSTTTLLFLDECGLGAQLANQLSQQGQHVITVSIGDSFKQLGNARYTLNPRQPNEYHALFQELYALDKFPNRVVHLWSVTETPVLGIEEFKQTQDIGFYSLLFLAHSLTRQALNHTVKITVVSNHIQSVTGDEELSPEKATILSLIKTIPQEYPNLNCRSLDIVLPNSETQITEKFLNWLQAELSGNSQDKFVAYRGNHRWVQSIESARLAPPSQTFSPLRKQGVYLITGGLGSIGLALAEHLAKTVQAKLILTGSSEFPAQHQWEQWLTTYDESDRICQKIRQVQNLEKLGSEVLVIRADVANLQQMQEVINSVEQRFGQIHGVIHAAGLVGGDSFTTLDTLNPSNCEQQFHAKVYGTTVLEKVFYNRSLDFCLLLSSISSVLGGLGLSAYAAANLFMDTFVQKHNQIHPVPWFSINWDAWQVKAQQQSLASAKTSLTELAIAPVEGIAAFQRILESDNLDRVIVSTSDLHARINQWIQPKLTKVQEPLQPKDSLEQDVQSNCQNSMNDIEQTIADNWRSLLGIEQVGIDDDFFAIGGDSLMVIQLVTKLREIFAVKLSIQVIFEQPTIAQLAQTILQLRQSASEQLMAVQPTFVPAPKLETVVPFSFHVDSPSISGQERKKQTQNFYDSVTQQLNFSEVGEWAMFLNYGYIANDNLQYAKIDLLPNILNKNSIHLVLEVIGECNLEDCRVLDVGCGRGGTVQVISRYFQPQEIIGIDLSPKAIEFCQAQVSANGVHFLQGDAENLPFEDNRFDVIVNIESSHNYPHIFQFYEQVYRCLKKDGYFLYTDVLQTQLWDSYLLELQQMGFILEHDRDITTNVLLSCDDKANRQMEAFHQDNEAETLKYFLAVPGSDMYEKMKNGALTYKVLRLKKS